MPRPRICRRIRRSPGVTYFKPVGTRMVELGEVILTFDEYEAIRLVDLEGVEQTKAGKQMKISQPTFSRVLKSARKKISEAIIKGKAIKIKGGDFEMVQPRGVGLGRGMRRGQKRGITAGPGGDCICPKCKYKISHNVGVPCSQETCPRCGAKMTRLQK